ncbi:hypothetical protein [Lelliottia wanjuensis]|uniref:hypothetical protein n=1 Tax=Lelliottia wanjuensis TaxID=3050585 RepID=UPI00254A57FF|nr:hypothetical protein [Lelliottia sp. V86_10]MDK9585456.1 hypothetical protein [Lelliottia sp. V86_10]
MSKSITLQIKQSRPDAEETAYFWKLFHAAQRVENRWYSDLNEISDELSATDLSREQKLFLLRAWQVLVDDKGGFGRFMGAFDTYVFNMQDPNDDCCAWKPELKQLIEDGNLFSVMLEAYQDAQQHAKEQGRHACALFDEVQMLQERVHLLERKIILAGA